MFKDSDEDIIRWLILEHRNRSAVGLLVTDTLGGILAIVKGKVPLLG